MEKTNKKKGLYQIRRIQIDIREKQAKANVESNLNSALIDLQSDDNIVIIDVTEQIVDKNTVYALIKFYDYGLNN